MRLKQVTIAGYRSIRKPTTLHVETGITVILGPNDHGKTNCLNALVHLNEDAPFVEDRDLNWDNSGEEEALPSIVAIFELTPEEIRRVLELENPGIEAHNRKVMERKAAAEAEDPAGVLEPEGFKAELYPILKEADVAHVKVKRVGVKGELQIEPPEQLLEDTEKHLLGLVPRFELINPVDKLSDSVTSAELAQGQNEFMRGIFYYAGLDPDAAVDLFEQNDRTQRQLEKASEALNRTLREAWSQGRTLKFRLRHDSQHKRIELLIEDPSVESRFVRASRRSSGFTHYFALKTILHARQRDHEANSYFLLFDEPGIYLHPSGQHDLLQVLEMLATESQIAYVTHSLFMINKTFPARHRLLMKGEGGTTLDGKPYVGRWQAVLGALGMTLTGTILFSNFVVLTEGDSDPIYLYAMLQKAVAAGKCRIDLNAVTFLSTGESKHADVLIRLLVETAPKPTIGVIADGDQGGKDRQVYLNAMIQEHGLPERILTKDTSIEDHVPNLREVFVPAVADYVSKLLVLKGDNKPDEEEFRAKFFADFDSVFSKGRVTTKVIEWAEKAAISIGGLKSKPSKVGIAREYAAMLLELPDNQLKWADRSKVLADWLMKEVKVPELSTASKSILQEESLGD